MDDRSYNNKAPLALQREPAHYLGYVYFRQVKDSSVKRGYFQKNISAPQVLLVSSHCQVFSAGVPPAIRPAVSVTPKPDCP